MKILIISIQKVSETHFAVEGITFEGKSVRLMNEDGTHQGIDHPFLPKQIWDMDLVKSPDKKRPHQEDVIIKKMELTGSLETPLEEFLIENNITILDGNMNSLFEGKLKWTHKGSGTGYITPDDVCAQSLAFWKTPTLLIQSKNAKDKYNQTVGKEIKTIKYTGIDTPHKQISANVLLRVSLADWWDGNGEFQEKRSYLNIAGYFDWGGK